jgi:beta-mannosidase
MGLGFVHSAVDFWAGLSLRPGPVLMTIGPWRPISLHTYQTRIDDLYIRSKVGPSLDSSLSVDFTLLHEATCTSSVALLDADGNRVIDGSNLTITNGRARAEFSFSAGTIDLWYPVGYGKQPLYTVEIQVADQVRYFSAAQIPPLAHVNRRATS